MENIDSKNGNKTQDEKLLQPYTYLLQVTSENVLMKLIRTFNYWLNIPEDKLMQIEEIIQMLHNTSLLLDDIQDNSLIRGGISVAHSVYGVASTINAANYVMFIALEKCLLLNHPKAATIFTEQILEVIRGQGTEIYWRDKFTCPTEEEYCDMAVKQTGAGFLLGIRLMQLFSENKQDFTKFTSILGLAFQIRDDYINLCSEDYMLGKSYCEDLTEGKFSFPLMHAIHSQPDGEVVEILKSKTTDNNVKKYCVSLLEKCGSFAYTRAKMAELEKDAKDELKLLGPNPYMNKVINYIFKDNNNNYNNIE